MYKRTNKILLVDTTFLFDQYSNRGIGRYGKELLKRLIKTIFDTKGWELQLVGFYDLEQNLIETGLSTFSIEEFTYPIKFHSLGKPQDSGIKNILFWETKLRPVIKDVKPDVYFGVHFERGLPSTKFLGRGLKNIKSVVTAHDTIPLINQSFSQKSFFHNYLKGAFYKFMWTGVERAHVVFAPSEHSKQDLVKFGDVPLSSIKRTYLGIDESFYKDRHNLKDEEIGEILETYEVQEKSYFFYDSGLEANKGVDHLLEIFSRLSDEDEIPDYLVVTGSSFKKGVGEAIVARTNEADSFIRKAKELEVLEHLITTDRIPEEDLIQLLQHSDGYLYFSEYEGFGFGPIQAMASEIPAFVANTSCLPEITNGGAHLVDAHDYDDAANEISKTLKNKSKLAEQIKIGQKVAQSYTWERTVEETWNTIQKVAPT